MTGYTVHTGTNAKFSQGWDRIFSAAKTSKAAAKSAAKPASKKASKKKSSGK